MDHKYTFKLAKNWLISLVNDEPSDPVYDRGEGVLRLCIEKK